MTRFIVAIGDASAPHQVAYQEQLGTTLLAVTGDHEAVRDRTLLVDRRTGTTTTDLWPAGSGPAVEHIQDIDDWLAMIATGSLLSQESPRTLNGARTFGEAGTISGPGIDHRETMREPHWVQVGPPRQR